MLKASPRVHPHMTVAGHQDIRNVRFLKEVLEWPGTEQLALNPIDNVHKSALVENDAFAAQRAHDIRSRCVATLFE